MEDPRDQLSYQLVEYQQVLDIDQTHKIPSQLLGLSVGVARSDRTGAKSVSEIGSLEESVVQDVKDALEVWCGEMVFEAHEGAVK